MELKERLEIYRLRKNGEKIRAIAKAIARSPASISRELRRNRLEIDYLPDSAHMKYKNRLKGRKHKLKQQIDLREYVVSKLRDRWSPEQIAGRMKLERQAFYASHETIYQFVYSNAGKDLSLWYFLRYRQAKRGQLYGRKSRTEVIKERISIDQRPPSVEERKIVGHFEGDLTFFKGDQSSNLIVLVERASRLTLLIKNESKKAAKVAELIYNKIKDYPQHVRYSITFDNGSEFAKHTLLRDSLNMKTFFCNPGAPWQKGSVENSINRLHGHIPKGTMLKLWTDQAISAIEHKINRTPRRCLGFLSPYEVFFREFRSVALQT